MRYVTQSECGNNRGILSIAHLVAIGLEVVIVLKLYGVI